MPQVVLDNFGGLVASMRPSDLPAGASPRTYNTDFLASRFLQRPGRQNVYSYSGEIDGPNPPFSAVSTSIGNIPWVNAGNILLNDGNYATAALGGSSTIVPTPTMSGALWTNVANATSTSLYASTSGGDNALYATVPALAIPSNSIINGIEVTFKGYVVGASAPSTVSSIYGDAVTKSFGIAWPSSAGSFYTGGTTDLWNMTSAQILSGFKIQIAAPYLATSYLNNLVITIYYSAPTESDALDVTDFAFSVPLTQSVTGIKADLKGYTSGSQTVSAQLLSGGLLVGTAKDYSPSTGVTTVSLGNSGDGWGAALSAASVNATTFGVRLIASGAGTMSFDYCTITLYLTSSNPNFNFIDTFRTDNGTLFNLALDQNGNWWLEDATNAPGILNEILTHTTAASWATGASVYGRAFVSNTDLTGKLVTGSDIPRQYNLTNNWWDRVTQVGPAAPPDVFASEQASDAATITQLEITANVITVTAANTYTAGEVGTFSGITDASWTFLNGLTLTVLSTGLSTSAFEVAYNNGGVHVGPTAISAGTFTPQYVYPLATITQPAQMSDPDDPGHFQALLWSAGPGSTSSGNVVTVYYENSFSHSSPDTVLVDAFNSGNPVYVYISGAPFGNGVWQVTSIGNAIPPKGAYYRYYFTFQVPTANYQLYGGPDDATGYYQVTQATVTASTPIPGLQAGAQVLIANASVASWNNTWTIVNTLNSGAFNITATELSGGIATYSWTLVSGSAPSPGQLVTITNTNNANGILNVVDALVATSSGVSSGTFTIAGFASSLNYTSAVEQGQATTAGTQFLIDPGAALVGSTSSNPIYGDATGGTVTLVGAASGSTFPIGAGTRQLVCMFRTRNGFLTAPSPPVTFTVATGSNYVSVANVPIGPPGTVARQFAITQAGALGIAGGNFYTFTVPVTFTVNGISYTSTPLVVNDNTTTSAKFTFSDQVLLTSEAIDIPGNNLFNQIEIGNPGWIRQFLSRTFYGACQNKVQNFNNLSFDGGYLAPVGAAPPVPLGWSIDPTYSYPFGTSFSVTAFAIASNIVTVTTVNTLTVGQTVVIDGLSTGTYLNGIQLTILTVNAAQFTATFTHADVTLTSDSGTVKTICNTIALRPSPNTGNSLYIQNQTATTQATIGMLTQTAYQDDYGVAILNPSSLPTAYSVRIKCRTPSSTATGNIVVDLVDSNNSVYGSSYGSFTLALSSLTDQMAIYEGTLTASAGIPTIPNGLLLRIYGTAIPSLGDFEVDWLQIFPTNEPVLANVVYVSYPGRPEAVDGTDGRIALSSQTQDPAMGMQVIHNTIFFPKQDSIIECEIAGNLQPSQWSTREVSRRVGACGPNAMAQGNDWSLMLHKSGLYLFNGGVPYPISRELQAQEPGAALWDQINWDAAQTFWLVTDLEQRRLYIGVAMKTPNFWLPNEPTLANPTQPNVILMCNYDGVPAPNEIMGGSPVHVTMFGDLKSPDMRRKWSIWTGATPYGAVVFDGLYSQNRLFLCNGIGSGKIYRMVSSNTQMTDDGTPIEMNYTTYGMTSMGEGQQKGVGAGQKQANRFMANIDGSGSLGIKWYQNTLEATYPMTCPLPVTMSNPAQNNIERRMSVRFQRLFTEFSMDGTAPGFCEVGEVMVEMSVHPWGSYRTVAQ